VRGELPEGWTGRAEKVISAVEKLLGEIEQVFINNAIFKQRAQGLGIIEPEMIDPYAVVGPNARGSGVKRDLRKDTPYLIYDQLSFDIITESSKDAYGRFLVRWRETQQAIDLIRQIIKDMPTGGAFHITLPNVLHLKVPKGQTYVKAESTRGEYGYFLVSDGSAFPRKVTVRGPSYSHAMALLEYLAVGVNIADVAGLIVSLHTYPPEVER